MTSLQRVFAFSDAVARTPPNNGLPLSARSQPRGVRNSTVLANHVPSLHVGHELQRTRDEFVACLDLTYYLRNPPIELAMRPKACTVFTAQTLRSWVRNPVGLYTYKRLYFCISFVLSRQKTCDGPNRSVNPAKYLQIKVINPHTQILKHWDCGKEWRQSATWNHSGGSN